MEQAEAKAVLAGARRFGDADHQGRVLAGVAFVVARGDEAAGAAAAIHVHAQRLGWSHGEIRAELGGRGEHAQRQGVDTQDRLRTGGARQPDDLRRVGLDRAEIARCFEIDRGGARRELGAKIGEVDQAGRRIGIDGDDGQMRAHLRGLAVAPDHRQTFRIDQPRHDDLAPTGEPCRHAQRMARGAAPRVDGQADQVEAQKLAELAGKLEPGLVAAVVGRGPAEHRVQPFGAVHDLVAHRRDIVLPAAGAEEIEIALARDVLGQQVADVAAQRAFRRQCRRQVDRPLQAMAGGDLLEQRLDVLDADGVEHLPAQFRHRVGHIGMGHPSLLLTRLFCRRPIGRRRPGRDASRQGRHRDRHRRCRPAGWRR